MLNPALRCTAFSGSTRIATGELRHVAIKVKQVFDTHPERPLLVFEDAGGQTVELPLELPTVDLLRLIEYPEVQADTGTAHPHKRPPGRPKLGVVPREVTLLPRHWDWLAAQPGGASVALRRLVDEARKVSAGEDRRRAAQEATYRFMLVMAGDAPGFEDAARALFAGDAGRFENQLLAWPEDVREHALWLATDAFVG